MQEAGRISRDWFVEDPECHTKNEAIRPANMYVALISNKAVCPVFTWLIPFNPLNNPLRQAESVFCRSSLRPREVKPPADPWPHQNLTQAAWLWSPHLQPKPLLRLRPGGQGSWQFPNLWRAKGLFFPPVLPLPLFSKEMEIANSWPQGLGFFPGGSVVKNLPANAGDVDFVPGLGRSPEEVNGNPLQYSCLENPMDRGAGGLQSMELQRVRLNLVTKQQASRVFRQCALLSL